ncbi:hypothetical protein HYFRA_00013573 [Hymenoscyphus fraxineus]|uniref:HCP-like protein n=1 Tax=Hymenoscyphus fraxineus TaxID=746836 RepID=A0A9N9LB11_9HELO|nr:hypothetical protein HYFRA_00013573 [Hymenoscyphus fraxineus]
MTLNMPSNTIGGSVVPRKPITSQPPQESPAGRVARQAEYCYCYYGTCITWNSAETPPRPAYINLRRVLHCTAAQPGIPYIHILYLHPTQSLRTTCIHSYPAQVISTNIRLLTLASPTNSRPPLPADHQPSRIIQPQSGSIEGGMSDQYSNHAPRLSATFIPGHDDDFFVPEIVSPAPQRIMPEVPSNMQEQLTHLEQHPPPPTHRMSNASSMSGMQSPPFLDQHRIQNNYPSSQHERGPGFTASYEHTNASAYQNIDRDNVQYGGERPDPDSPRFTPFPKPRDAGPNVPLSDEDKEEVLERARTLVLKSTDPEMQLAWAQDALSWVEVAQQCAARLQAEGHPARSVTPKTEHSLRIDALSIVGFLADQHHPKAEFMRSMWYEFGKFNHPVDKKEAFLGYKRAAERGFARAEYRMGMQFESSNNSVKAIDHYSRGVEMGDSAAHYRLGMMTLLGQHGMPQDFRRGVDLVRYSAETADENAPQGAYVYGMLLSRELPNISVPEQFLPFDLNDAKLFIEKAAYLGFAKAQLKMAQAYELCQLGCEFEPALSLHYNSLAARQGESEADMAISKWFLCGYEGVFEKNEELAFTYAKRAAGTKMATAEFAMGYFYEIGMYVPVDLEESAMWYAKAADHGNKDALGRIDSIRKNSTLSKKDHEQVAINRIKSQHGSQRGGRPERFKQRNNPMPSIADSMSAPYPENDVAPVFNGQALRSPGGGPMSDQASSAFGIKPLGGPGYDQGPGRGYDGMRASSSMGNMQIPAGRGHNAPGRAGVVSTGWDPQGQGRMPPPQQGGFLPPVDVGRPFDQNRQGQKPAPLNPNKPQRPPPPGQGYSPDPRVQQGFSPDPRGQQGYSPDPRGQQNFPARPGPPPMMSPPQTPGYGNPHANNSSRASNRPPPQHTMPSHQQRPDSSHTGSIHGGPNSRPGSAAPSVTPSTASSTASKKPAKAGPATFEEMGIPVTKQDNECVVM